MTYAYGSCPTSYNYKDFVKHLAPVLPKDDLVFSHKGSDEWRKNHNRIPFELFKNICHWKSPRRTRLVCGNAKQRVNKQWKKALRCLNAPRFNNDAIICALNELTDLDGVGLPTASALLTAWSPKKFGIIDRKVCEVLYGKERYISPKLYVDYRQKLLDLKKEHKELKECTLRQIELAIWHYNAIQETGETSRKES